MRYQLNKIKTPDKWTYAMLINIASHMELKAKDDSDRDHLSGLLKIWAESIRQVAAEIKKD